MFDDAGGFTRNVFGLGGVTVQRTGARLGTDVPGDERSAEVMHPLSAEAAREIGLIGLGSVCP